MQPSALQRLEEWWNADEMNGYVIKSRIDYVEVMLWRDGADEELYMEAATPSPTPSTPHWMRRRGSEQHKQCGGSAVAGYIDDRAAGNERNWRREQVKQLGNAVTSPVMVMLMRRIVETFQ